MTPAQLALLLEVAEAIRALMAAVEWECAATPDSIGALMEEVRTEAADEQLGPATVARMTWPRVFKDALDDLA